jgi:hypothetical protein
MTQFRVQDAARPECASTADEARVAFRGALVESAQRVDFGETCAVRAGNRFTLCFDFAARTDLNLRMWRHYFFFPVRDYAGATARSATGAVSLPAELGAEVLISRTQRVEIVGEDATVTVESSLPLSLVDHRKWGTSDYLLAGYPVGGAVKAGTQWSVEFAVTVAPR